MTYFEILMWWCFTRLERCPLRSVNVQQAVKIAVQISVHRWSSIKAHVHGMIKREQMGIIHHSKDIQIMGFYESKSIERYHILS